MENQIIEIGKEELKLVKKALELYCRLSLLQFEELAKITTIRKLTWDNKIVEKFDEQARELKQIFGFGSNSYAGIFSDIVSDDARIAMHMCQEIEHQNYLNSLENIPNKESYDLSERPADICQLGNMNIPNFKIKKHENV